MNSSGSKSPPMGSSPRVRGRPIDGGVYFNAPGLIPACAGQTRWSPVRRRGPRAHPRVCGADIKSKLHIVSEQGSSPRVRGRPSWLTFRGAFDGLIPACAGQTYPSYVDDSKAFGSSPRVRGRLPEMVMPGKTGRGSSPRVRGRHANSGSIDTALRLIPACAGQTGPGRLRSGRRTAHPRVCGADPRCRGCRSCSCGSSPRVRGRPVCGGVLARPPGLIPACAGQTAGVRTENMNSMGSSPRVRGRLYLVVVVYPPAGLIPACAGQTLGDQRCCIGRRAFGDNSVARF